jgi:hypothetical protein
MVEGGSGCVWPVVALVSQKNGRSTLSEWVCLSPELFYMMHVVVLNSCSEGRLVGLGGYHGLVGCKFAFSCVARKDRLALAGCVFLLGVLVDSYDMVGVRSGVRAVARRTGNGSSVYVTRILSVIICRRI